MTSCEHLDLIQPEISPYIFQLHELKNCFFLNPGPKWNSLTCNQLPLANTSNNFKPLIIQKEKAPVSL